MVAPQLMTIDDGEAMGPDAERYGLVRDGLRAVNRMGERRGAIGGRAIVSVGGFVLQHALATETKSPPNTGDEVRDKISISLAGGSKLDLLIGPVRRIVTVYRPLGPEQILGEGDVLDGEDLLP